MENLRIWGGCGVLGYVCEVWWVMLALMEDDSKSVRNLAKEVGVSPTVIQEIRSGKRANITLKNFVNIMKALGAEVAVKKGKNYFTLEMAA